MNVESKFWDEHHIEAAKKKIDPVLERLRLERLARLKRSGWTPPSWAGIAGQ